MCIFFTSKNSSSIKAELIDVQGKIVFSNDLNNNSNSNLNYEQRCFSDKDIVRIRNNITNINNVFKQGIISTFSFSIWLT